MKLIMESWRKYLNEATQQPQNLGVYVKSDPNAWVELSLVDLNAIQNSLDDSKNSEEFLRKLKDKEVFNSAVVGYIKAYNNKFLAKAHAGIAGGSGGLCYETWSVKESIGRGYGEQLYNALLGWAAGNNVYLTADRTSVSPGAEKRWSQIDNQTSDEIPPKEDPYIGRFDDFKKKETEPLDDDCVVFADDSLNKGYKDESKISYFNGLQDKLNNFFKDKIQSLFDEPGFWGKILRTTPKDRAEKIKKQLLSRGADKFADYILKREKS
tara:strand:- start:194 stop:994 length:801 start_codon:yes stop_codon:yes gene_type:complete